MDPNHTGIKVLLAIIFALALVVLGIVVYVSLYPLGTALPWRCHGQSELSAGPMPRVLQTSPTRYRTFAKSVGLDVV